MPSASHDSKSASDDSSSDEWQAARDVLADCDDHLHDLRKYGFSFITGLLSVEALFYVGQGSWKLAALVGTLFLIVPLDFVDRNYRILQEAASLRAQIIERRTRMNLTQTIERMFVDAHVRFIFETVYIIFIFATLLVGWMVFGTAASFHLWSLVTFCVAAIGAVWGVLWHKRPRSQYVAGLVLDAAALVAIVVAALVAIAAARWKLHPTDFQTDLSLLLGGMGGLRPHLSSLPIHYHLVLLVAVTIAIVLILIIERLELSESVDFEIDGFDYTKGDEVLAMITNVGSKNLVLSDPQRGVNDPALTIHRESDGASIYCEGLGAELDQPITLWKRSKFGWSDYRWLISTERLDPGLYRAVYRGPAYFRTGRFVRKFNLLDPRNERDESQIMELGYIEQAFGYDPWFDAAQRFRVHSKKGESTTASVPPC